MIIIRPKGGLASQLHKFFIGHALATRYKTKLKVDMRHYQKIDYHLFREFILDKFNITLEQASFWDLFRYNLIKKYKLFSSVFKYQIYSGLNNFETFKSIQDNAYLTGEWIIGDIYYKNNYNELQKFFVLKYGLSENASELKMKIETCNSISLHFRRGDYVSNPKCNAFHGGCSIDYYQRALLHITSTIPNCELFIFSDDIEWVQDNFHTSLPQYYINFSPEEDIVLMSKCKYNIIANSGYSWMASCFNSFTNKIVIAPNQWVQDSELNSQYYNHMEQNNWILLDN